MTQEDIEKLKKLLQEKQILANKIFKGVIRKRMDVDYQINKILNQITNS